MNVWCCETNFYKWNLLQTTVRCVDRISLLTKIFNAPALWMDMLRQISFRICAFLLVVITGMINWLRSLMFVTTLLIDLCTAIRMTRKYKCDQQCSMQIREIFCNWKPCTCNEMLNDESHDIVGTVCRSGITMPSLTFSESFTQKRNAVNSLHFFFWPDRFLCAEKFPLHHNGMILINATPSS